MRSFFSVGSTTCSASSEPSEPDCSPILVSRFVKASGVRYSSDVDLIITLLLSAILWQLIRGVRIVHRGLAALLVELRERDENVRV
jgi:hypothetical protein